MKTGLLSESRSP